MRTEPMCERTTDTRTADDGSTSPSHEDGVANLRLSSVIITPGVILVAAALVPVPAASVPSPGDVARSVAVATPGGIARPVAVAPPAPQDDVDAFMEEVLAKREINWQATYDYVFNEVERLRIRGGEEIAALQSFDQEYTWYVRDGFLVRSPWSVNGVEVDADEREAAELEWIADVQEDENNARIQRDNFFDFEFEPGNYLFAGRETFEGREVVRIEYYPTQAFFSEDDEGEPERRREPEPRDEPDPDEKWDENYYNHMFAKTSLVTLLIVPEEHQIVKWTFENVGFEFLPYRWLVRMDELHASMVMHQPIEGVWLPREIRASARASTANFDLEITYSRAFGDYKEPAVGAGVIFGRPKRDGGSRQ